MPELPEVEEAVRRLRAVLQGRTIIRIRPLHPSLMRRLPPRTRRALQGAVITRVERRGKHQLIHLGDGRVLHVHFRMSGDWQVVDGRTLPRSARLVIELDDHTRVALVDPRALGTVDVHAADAPPALALGPEATDPGIDPDAIRQQLARRKQAIKPVLLDQRVIAGVGNIYAAEALWHAKLDPRTPASDLTRTQVVRLLAAVRTALARADGERYVDGGAELAVYDRLGEPCRRCGHDIDRIVQGGRSTYFCPRCQASRAPRGARP